jgi:hypothetical protein
MTFLRGDFQAWEYRLDLADPDVRPEIADFFY